MDVLLCTYILFSICDCGYNLNPLKSSEFSVNPPTLDICVAPFITNPFPFFTHDIQYAPIQYENEHTIEQYDMINNEASGWPYLHSVWGFKAASISMAQSNGKDTLTENILIPAIPIYVPDGGKTLAIARPQGKYFYVFSAAHYNEFANGGPYTATGIVFFDDKTNTQITDFRIMTSPTRGVLHGDERGGKFCNPKYKHQGICFGEQRCCEAFDRILSIVTASKCQTILLCPKGVFKVNLFEYSPSASTSGLAQFAISGFEVQDTDKNMNDKIRKLFVTEPGYICPDGSYQIRLSCPRIGKSLGGYTLRSKVKVDESEFHDCPFCSHPKHKYRIVVPSEGNDVRGKCNEKNKKTLVSFEFINDDSVHMSCCIKSHTPAPKHINGAYSKRSIDEEINFNAMVKTKSEESNEVIEEQPITGKQEPGRRQPIKDGKEKVNGKQTAEKEKSNVLNESGFVTFSATRSLIVGVLIGILMLIASLHIYFN